MPASRKPLLLASVALVVLGSGAGSQGMVTYTQAQADRGHAVYERACTSCHAADLHGDENAEVPALVGENFDRSWRGEPLSALFDKASKTMPADRPGALTPAEYADIIAYLLQANRVPVGSDELHPDPAALRSVIPPLAERTP